MLNPNAIQRITSLSNDDIILVADRDINRTNRGRTDLYTKRIRYSDLVVSLQSSLNIASSWGDISGTLSNQTDLQAELDAKADLAGDTFTGTIEIQNEGAVTQIVLSNNGSASFTGDITTTGITNPPVELNGNNTNPTWSIRNSQFAIIEANTNLDITISSPRAGQVYTLIVKNPSGRGIRIGDTLWPDGVPPTFSTGTDVVTIFYDGINFYGVNRQSFS